MINQNDLAGKEKWHGGIDGFSFPEETYTAKDRTAPDRENSPVYVTVTDTYW